MREQSWLLVLKLCMHNNREAKSLCIIIIQEIWYHDAMKVPDVALVMLSTVTKGLRQLQQTSSGCDVMQAVSYGMQVFHHF